MSIPTRTVCLAETVKSVLLTDFSRTLLKDLQRKSFKKSVLRKTYSSGWNVRIVFVSRCYNGNGYEIGSLQ